MSNLAATYVILVIALATATPLTFAIPASREHFKPAHAAMAAFSAIAFFLCICFLGVILLDSPSSREKPELVAPFALALLMLGILVFRVIRLRSK